MKKKTKKVVEEIQIHGFIIKQCIVYDVFKLIFNMQTKNNDVLLCK